MNTANRTELHTAYGRAEKCQQYGVCITNLAQLPFITLSSFRQLPIGAQNENAPIKGEIEQGVSKWHFL